MNTEIQGETQPAQQTAPKRRTSVIAVVTAVVGGLVLLGMGTSAAVATVAASTDRGASATGAAAVDSAGISSIDVEIGAASFTVEYAAVSEITLDTAGPRGNDWTLRRSGDELIVKSPRTNFGGSCFFGFCPPVQGQRASATLTLPNEFESRTLDAAFEVGAGELNATGTFGELEVEVGVGSATLAGAARELDASVDVGSLTGDLEGVQEADIAVAVGEATVTFRGNAPRDVELNVDLGSLKLTLPSGVYDVKTKNDLGKIDNRLDSSANARNTISATVSLGDIILQQAN